VAFDAPLEDWLAAPLLYVQGHTFPKWNEAERAKVRAFVEQGGTLLAEACCGREEFRTGFARFARETFPDAPLRELGPDHGVYHVLHEVAQTGWPGGGGKPGLQGIDYGCRTAIFFSPRDLSCLWEQADVPGFSPRAFELGTNIVAYAIGRRPLRDRLDAVVVPLGTATPVAVQGDALRLGQIVYDSDWHTFPRALPGLAEFLRDSVKMDVVPQPAQLRLTDPELPKLPILVLAGHREFELSAEERTVLAAHLRRGGFLIADACCGAEPFAGAVRRLFATLFPEGTVERLPADHPLFSGAPGFAIDRVQFSPDVRRAQPDLHAPELWGLRVDGRLVAVLSPYSLSCGLSGPVADGCWGYERADAQRLAANIVVWALTH
jgi:hypothetical protein